MSFGQGTEVSIAIYTADNTCRSLLQDENYKESLLYNEPYKEAPERKCMDPGDVIIVEMVARRKSGLMFEVVEMTHSHSYTKIKFVTTLEGNPDAYSFYTLKFKLLPLQGSKFFLRHHDPAFKGVPSSVLDIMGPKHVKRNGVRFMFGLELDGGVCNMGVDTRMELSTMLDPFGDISINSLMADLSMSGTVLVAERMLPRAKTKRKRLPSIKD